MLRGETTYLIALHKKKNSMTKKENPLLLWESRVETEIEKNDSI